MKYVWLVLKILGMYVVGDVCYVSVRDLAWVKGATGDGRPFLISLVLCPVFLFWAYSVIWKPIEPRKQ